MEKRRKMDEGTGIDRISELPEAILHHIQSLLLLEEAVRTSALSKAWNTVWSTLPYLNFNDRYFDIYCRGDTDTTNQKLSAFIGETLNHRRRQGIRIQKFGLDYRRKLDLYSHLDSWIDCLKVCKIDEIMIELDYSYNLSVVPPSLFTIESLTTLRLGRCKLPCPAIEHIKLLNLRKLCLEYVDIDDKLLHHIFSICQSLEYLKVRSQRIQRLRISGLPKLKIIITEYVKDVEVEATSNLQELSVSHLGLLPKINPAYCGNTLKCLKLTSVSVKDDVFSRLIPNLQVLETLSLSLEEVNCNVLRLSSHSLKHLNLCSRKMVFEAEIDTPNLQKFRYVGKLLNFSFKHNLAIGHVELGLWGSRIDGNWLIKLIQLLQKFNHSKVVKLSIPYLEMSKEMREKLLAPLLNVKHFFICCCNIPSSTPLSDAVTQVLDGSLWMSSCLKDLVMSVDGIEDYDYDWLERPSYYDEGFIISLKLMYEKEPKEDIEENESCCQCDSIPLRCWQHSLKTVEIEKKGWSERIDDAVQSVKNYFMANLRSRSECDVSKLFTERWVSYDLSDPTEYPFI